MNQTIENLQNPPVAVYLIKSGNAINDTVDKILFYSVIIEKPLVVNAKSRKAKEILELESICKVFIQAEVDVTTLELIGLHVNNYVSLSSLIRCLDKPSRFFDPKSLESKIDSLSNGSDPIELVAIYKRIKMIYNEYIYIREFILEEKCEFKRLNIDRAVEREIRVLPSVIRLNKTGLKFDLDKWLLSIDQKEEECKQLFDKICNELSIDNANSHIQLLEGLQERGLKISDTSEETLMQYISSDDIVESIIRYKKLSKIINGFGNNLKKHIGDDGRIRGKYNAHGTVTGRFSAKDPAVQNFPKICKDYFSADSGNILITADYKTIEMCILAHISHCSNMCEEINNGIDLHSKVAAVLFDKNIDLVTDKERQVAKQVNFGVSYGMTAVGLYRKLAGAGLDYTREQAQQFIDKFHSSYKEIHVWQEKCRQAMALFSIGGRYHSLDNLKDTQAINWAIQASGADIIKDALILLESKLSEHTDWMLVSVIHDSITLEVPSVDKELASSILTYCMKKAFQNLLRDINISIDVDYKSIA